MKPKATRAALIEVKRSEDGLTIIFGGANLSDGAFAALAQAAGQAALSLSRVPGVIPIMFPGEKPNFSPPLGSSSRSHDESNPDLDRRGEAP